MAFSSSVQRASRFPRRLLLLCGLLVWARLTVAADWQDPSIYQQAAVRDLVAMVNGAALLFEQQGEAAFSEFAKPGSRWFKGERYVFIYDTDGRCLFHPAQPERVGQNFLDFKDVLGRPVLRWLVAIGLDQTTPYGWIHYFWPPPDALLPVWKSAYAVAVTAPDGKRYVLSSGLYNLRPEAPFLTDLVDRSVALIEQRGPDAFAELADESSAHNLLGLYVYVISRSGALVVDPAFPDGSSRNALNYRDAVGHAFIRDAFERLDEDEATWVTYMWPEPGQSVPSKKVLYARRVQVGDEVYLVGSDMFLSHPIWLRY